MAFAITGRNGRARQGFGDPRSLLATAHATDDHRGGGGLRNVSRVGQALSADADGTRLSPVRREILPSSGAAACSERRLFGRAGAAANGSALSRAGARQTARVDFHRGARRRLRAVRCAGRSRAVGDDRHSDRDAHGSVLLGDGQGAARRPGPTNAWRPIWTGRTQGAHQHSLVKKAALREAVRQARAAGYGTTDQELEIGLRSVAVPVFDGKGDVLAAMSASASSARVTVAQMVKGFVPVLRKNADALGRAL